MHVQKWGNSLGVRLPKSLCEAVSIEEGSEIDFKIINDSIVIRRKKKTLEQLLESVNSENVHGETWDDVKPVGREIW